jgi:twitching motility protein PilT
MAAVDSLLKLIPARNAEALTIISNAVPQLRKGGEPAPLSMPPLSAALVSNFVTEVGGSDAKRYCTEDGAVYSVRVETADDGICMTFVPAGGPKASTPAPEPPMVALVEDRSSYTGEIDELLCEVERRGASDLVLSSGSNAWLRVDGAMREIPGTCFSDELLLRALNVDRADLGASGSLDFALQGRRRYRVNVFRQSRGIAAALRPIRDDPPTLADLRLPHTLHELVELRNGLVLVTGTAGSGKSTTLAALIEHLNHTRARHIITLEDPIEYEYRPVRCLIHQREIGEQVPDFATGLRSALRESPDIILVGELRDRETIAAAITAAETGHLVLGTLHASSAMVAIDRLIDVFPSDQQRQIRYQLATTLRATLTQILLPSTRAPGRAPAIELMRANDAIAANIRDNKTHHIPSAIQTGRASGMIPLEQSLARMVRNGLVERADAQAAAKEPAFFRELLMAG